MKHFNKIIVIIIPIVVIFVSILWISLQLEEQWLNTIEIAVTIWGLILVLIELNESKNISEGSFVSELSDRFNSNEKIQNIYKKLENKESLTDSDIPDIVAYLTYFETIYVLLKKRTIDITLIDDLFAYRFSLAIANKTIQRVSLIKHDTSYVNIYQLEKKWCKYKQTKSILEKNPNYEIILRGNKMLKDDVILKIATIDNTEEIHDIMSRVYDNLQDKTIYVCDDIDYVRAQIKSEGFAVIACNQSEEIVGCFIVRYPQLSEDNLGRDINMEENELPKVVHMESAVVLPEYRGKSLQLKMLRYAELLINTNKYKYLMATVSPDNPASYKTFDKNGYKLMTTKEKYNGLMRRIYLKEI